MPLLDIVGMKINKIMCFICVHCPQYTRLIKHHCTQSIFNISVDEPNSSSLILYQRRCWTLDLTLVLTKRSSLII